MRERLRAWLAAIPAASPLEHRMAVLLQAFLLVCLASIIALVPRSFAGAATPRRAISS